MPQPVVTADDDDPPKAGESSEDVIEDEWVPLEHPTECNMPPKSASVTSLASTASSQQEQQQLTVCSGSARDPVASTRRSSRKSNDDSVLALQQKVEMRRHLKQRLVHHPMQLLWSHFLWHLAQEFWTLDTKIRIALLFLLVGALCRVACWMTWYLWYPRTIVMICTLLGSWVYLDHAGIPRHIESFVRTLADLPKRIPETLEKMDPKQARMLCVLMLFVPTLLQMRTISFLADVNASGGTWMWNFFVFFLLVALSAYHLSSPGKKAARDIFQLCVLILYGSALWITLKHWNLLTMPSLAAPFFLSTGTLLLSYDDHHNMEWFSHMVRHALRLTLRDVLATLGTSLQEDEMLQLAMLRWIVDYWSYTPPPPQTGPTNSSSGNSTSPGASYTTTITQPPRQDLEWDELFPMLNVAADQMTSEVQSLQEQQQSSGSSSIHSGSPPGNASTSKAYQSLQNFQAMLACMNIDDRAKPAVESWSRNVKEFPPNRQLALLVSITRRCPACLVLIWQFLVASMFQSYGTTLRILLLLLPLLGLEVLRIQAWLLACESLNRLLEAGEATKSTTGTDRTEATASLLSSSSSGSLLAQVDPMTILLSGDDDTILTTTTTDTNEGGTNVITTMTIPTLLIVWRNIQSSVGALEVSLTAARCVHTGAVALEFAQNVMSLAQFGAEVQRYGWMHGLTVIVKEVILHRGNNAMDSRARGASYTHAAVHAVQNGQRVAHNLRVLAEEDDNLGKVLGPIVGGIFGIVGNLFQWKKSESEEDVTTKPQDEQEEKQSGQEGGDKNNTAAAAAAEQEEISGPVKLEETQSKASGDDEKSETHRQACSEKLATRTTGQHHIRESDEAIGHVKEVAPPTALTEAPLEPKEKPEQDNAAEAESTAEVVSNASSNEDKKGTSASAEIQREAETGKESDELEPQVDTNPAAETDPTEKEADQMSESSSEVVEAVVETEASESMPGQTTGSTAFVQLVDENPELAGSTDANPRIEVVPRSGGDIEQPLDDLASVMDLIAEAHERGLIDEVRRRRIAYLLACWLLHTQCNLMLSLFFISLKRMSFA
jgi:hypothetical protein